MISSFKLVAGRPTIEKDSDALLDYTADFTDWLGTDSISSAAVLVEGVTLDHHTVVGGKKVVVWLSGGVVGESAKATVRVTTAAGRIDDRTLYFRIVDK